MSLRFKIYRFWLLCFVLVTKIHTSCTDVPQESELKEFIICRQCGADIADSNYIVDHFSPELLNSQNQTLFGKPDVTIQTLINPFGIKFRIINTSKALCTSVGEMLLNYYFPLLKSHIIRNLLNSLLKRWARNQGRNLLYVHHPEIDRNLIVGKERTEKMNMKVNKR